MGDIADYAREQELETMWNNELHQDPEWITNDGRKLKVSDMDDNHILNCIKFIRRSNSNPDSIREWEMIFMAELERRHS